MERLRTRLFHSSVSRTRARLSGAVRDRRTVHDEAEFALEGYAGPVDAVAQLVWLNAQLHDDDVAAASTSESRGPGETRRGGPRRLRAPWSQS